MSLCRPQFRDLNIGDTFDFISPDRIMNSFYLRCEKISQRKYKDETGVIHRVGTINCYVYNVEAKEKR